MKRAIKPCARASVALAPFALALCLCTLAAAQGAGGLHLEVEGDGARVVVLEAGFGAAGEAWAKVRPGLARLARVVAYDRAGLGRSAPGPLPRTAARIAGELRTALKGAGLTPPYVLVGHSAGAAYVRVFAHLYPKEVAGLVLIDPPQEQFLGWLKAEHPEQDRMPAERLARMPEGVRAEWDARDAVIEEMRRAWPLPRVPALLLTSARNDRELSEGISPEALKVLEEARAEWLRRVAGARRVVAERAGHNIPAEEPELVVEAVRRVLAEATPARPKAPRVKRRTR